MDGAGQRSGAIRTQLWVTGDYTTYPKDRFKVLGWVCLQRLEFMGPILIGRGERI
jgi:hypothetical protein